MTYVFVVAMARLMSVTDFGILGTVMSASLLVSVFASFGQQMSLVRFVPPLLAQGDTSACHSIVARAAYLTTLGNALVWLALAGCVIGAGMVGRLHQSNAILIGLLIIPLVGIVDFQAALARSYQLVALSIAPKELFWRILSLIAVFSYILLTTDQLISLNATFTILTFTLIILIIFVYITGTRIYSLPKLRELRSAKASDEKLAPWRSARIAMWISSTSAVAFSNIDVVITALLIGPEGAAIYFAANRVATATNFFQQSYLFIVSPKLSQSFASGNLVEARKIAQRACLEVFLPTLVASICLAAIGSYVLDIFGSNFTAALVPLWILLLTSVIQTAFGIGEVALNMCGEERESMRIGLSTLIFGPMVISALGAVWAVNGIALGTFIVVIWRRWWFWRVASQRLAMRIDIVSSAKLTLNNK